MQKILRNRERLRSCVKVIKSKEGTLGHFNTRLGSQVSSLAHILAPGRALEGSLAHILAPKGALEGTLALV